MLCQLLLERASSEPQDHWPRRKRVHSLHHNIDSFVVLAGKEYAQTTPCGVDQDRCDDLGFAGSWWSSDYRKWLRQSLIYRGTLLCIQRCRFQEWPFNGAN